MIGIHNSNIYYPVTLGQKVNEHTSNIKNEDFLFKLTKIGSVATFSLNPLYSSTYVYFVLTGGTPAVSNAMYNVVY